MKALFWVLAFLACADTVVSIVAMRPSYDPCLTADCNNGICYSADGTGVVCICDPGYTGLYCDISPCASILCENNGTCEVDFNGVAVCDCPPRFSGLTCEIDACANVLCDNDGRCEIDSNGLAVCVCLPGYSGPTCGITPADLCDGVIECINGVCLLEGMGLVCVCNPGYSGDNCTISACASVLCENNGTCKLDSNGLAVCECPPRISGSTCQINACANVLCQNDGKCEIDSSGIGVCVCLPGFSGENCQITPSVPHRFLDCRAIPCVNGACAAATENGTEHKCFCKNGFSGDYCEISACASVMCENGATCEVDLSGLAVCKCLPGYSGQTCETSVCTNVLCQNNGTCEIDSNGIGVCVCLPGYSGPNCEINACADVLCQNDGTCEINSEGLAVCICLPGFTGINCDISIPDPCDDMNCQNGTCLTTWSSDPSGACICDLGYTGEECDTYVCASVLCENDGTCEVDSNGVAVCQCLPGYSGSTCGINVCANVVCQNNGTCEINSNGLAACVCLPEYSGPNCEINACADVLCQNGGSCEIDSEGIAVCVCLPGISGSNCERRDDQCRTKADIILIFDASSSITFGPFQQEFELAKALFRHFTIGDDDVLFSAMVFSFSTELLFYLNEHNNYADLDQAISNVDYMDSSTHKHVALESVNAYEIFSTGNGGRDDAVDVIILITDGDANRQNSTVEAADNLKDQGITIMAIAIGPEITMEKLEEVVSSPDDIVQATDNDALDVLEQRIADLSCESQEEEEEERQYDEPF